MAIPHKPHHNHTSISITNLTLSLLSILSLSLAAYFAIPSSFTPSLISSLKPWLAPPYLFIAVHLIIALIWKLSDYQKHLDHSPKQENKPKEPENIDDSPNSPQLPHTQSTDFWPQFSEPNSVPANVVELSANSAVQDAGNSMPPPVLELKNNMATDSAFREAGNSNPTPVLELKKSVASNSAFSEAGNSMPPPILELENSVVTKMAVECETSVPAEAMVELGDEGDEKNESIEETWKAIMEKSTTSKQKKEVSFEVVEDINEEMKRKFEDFIKKKRDQLKLERHESNQRRLLAGN